MDKSENGIRIRHEYLDKIIDLVAIYDKEPKRLHLSIGTTSMYLTPEETAHFLAQMAAWHKQGVKDAEIEHSPL